jgi:hypothetical protein
MFETREIDPGAELIGVENPEFGSTFVALSASTCSLPKREFPPAVILPAELGLALAYDWKLMYPPPEVPEVRPVLAVFG